MRAELVIAVVLAVCAGVGIAIHRARSERVLRRIALALRAGDPRRSRALARLYARRCTAGNRPWLALMEANALLWDGQFARAIAHVETRVAPIDDGTLGPLPTVVILESLLFDERGDEAKRLFEEERDRLLATEVGRDDVAAIAALLRFHAGELEAARAELEALSGRVQHANPIARVARLCLAAIAHRQGRSEDARLHLERTIAHGGELFVTRWAVAQWGVMFPECRPPDRAMAPHPVGRAPRIRELARNLKIGLEVLRFRTTSITDGTFTLDQIASLAVLNLVLVLALRAVDYAPGAFFFVRGAVLLVGPALLFLAVGLFATRSARVRNEALRVLGGFYAAQPLLLVIAFAAARIAPPHVAPWVEGLVAGWSIAIVVRLARSSAAPAPIVRTLAWGALLAATWLVPQHVAAPSRFFFGPVPDATADEAELHEQAELVFAQADKVHEVESALAGERPGVTDLYFVGAAGWADQDVFAHEVQAARKLLDERFDTRGRSVVLANDRTARDVAPLASTISLRHVLKTVGARMNREEDILFLFATSHGSTMGLGLRFPPRAAFEDEVLAPNDLASMLDGAGVRWRVLVLAGCESGVFVERLRTEETLIVTAAANDRNSYGCVAGRPFTDFGKAIFGEELRRERSFPPAFANAVKTIEKREAASDLRASLPQMFQGSRIAAKLRELEDRLGQVASEPASE